MTGKYQMKGLRMVEKIPVDPIDLKGAQIIKSWIMGTPDIAHGQTAAMQILVIIITGRI